MSTYIERLKQAKTKEDIIKVVSSHDYFYPYSDDGRVYENGRREAEATNARARTDATVKAVWQAYLDYWNILAGAFGQNASIKDVALKGLHRALMDIPDVEACNTSSDVLL